jgi:precorrin-2/cobalt-factor-2 C20-methyltransferase
MGEKKKGKLYGVSVGPGDPELMTLKAVRIIENTQVIATPVTHSGEMLAYDIASGSVDMTGKDIVKLYFTMSRDPEKLRESHEKAADLIEEHLSRGEDVAMLNLGDISVFGTYCYMQDIIRDRGYETEMAAGVTSFCAIASLLGISLTEMDEPLMIVPGKITEEVIGTRGTKVIMKSGKKLLEVMGILEKNGLLGRASMVVDAGLPDQKVFRDISKIESTDGLGYFATIIVK